MGRDRELVEILEETIEELDNPVYEAHLSPGSWYREELEAEIRRVVEGDESSWYVEGEHHRELPFVHLAQRPWRLRSFDLCRPPPDGAGSSTSRPTVPDLLRESVQVVDLVVVRLAPLHRGSRQESRSAAGSPAGKSPSS